MPIEFSNYQKNLFAEVETQTGHLMVNAVAGSGKTFSLLECMKLSKGNSIFVAFNKSIANELATKVPSHVTATTLHSFGLKAIIKHCGYVRVDPKKLSKIMQNVPATSFLKGMTGKEKADIFRKRQMITDLISIWKNTLIDFNNDKQVAEAAHHYSTNYDPNILGVARSIMEKSIANTRFVDFDDMIYLPVAKNFTFSTFDNVFVDECQDLNRAQVEMILRMVKKPNGRIIAVGDPKQSIYGFRGACIDAMPRIKEVLNAKELPLSVCYRCPTSHIKLAQEIVPWIEPAPNAKQGIIEYIATEEFTENIAKDNEPLVLCRTNAPLISYALKLIKQGKKAHIRGSDIGNYLRGIIIGFDSKSINELNNKIDEWENAQLEFLNKSWASNAVKETIIDYADCMREFSKQSANPFDVVQTIDRVFSDDNEGTIFSTIHKAKGLQADNVYIIRPDQIPLIRKDQQEWEFDQELNLKYVALTRSTNKLTFVKL
jgi:superfamily I DNA/RNA helicase